jgi:hypothetical protein
VSLRAEGAAIPELEIASLTLATTPSSVILESFCFGKTCFGAKAPCRLKDSKIGRLIQGVIASRRRGNPRTGDCFADTRNDFVACNLGIELNLHDVIKPCLPTIDVRCWLLEISLKTNNQKLTTNDLVFNNVVGLYQLLLQRQL